MTSLKLSLFMIRASLGFFLLMWGLDKVYTPRSSMGIFDHFYHTSITVNQAIGIGVAEIILGLLIMGGVFKTLTYFTGFFVHAISTLSTFDQLLNPFGKNHLFLAAIPIAFAFLGLFLSRKEDTLFCIPKPKFRISRSPKEGNPFYTT